MNTPTEIKQAIKSAIVHSISHSEIARVSVRVSDTALALVEVALLSSHYDSTDCNEGTDIWGTTLDGEFHILLQNPLKTKKIPHG